MGCFRAVHALLSLGLLPLLGCGAVAPSAPAPALASPAPTSAQKGPARDEALGITKETKPGSAPPGQAPGPRAVEGGPSDNDLKSVEPDSLSAPKASRSKGGKGGAHEMVQAGTSQVVGALPPEVIQRIVRQSFGRFQACYEAGLRTNPNLQGRVTVRLVIAKDGSAKSADVAVTDLADKTVATCVARAFSQLTFPAPDRGEVIVSYPVVFSPGEGPSP